MEMSRCSVCGSLLTRDMKICCENCGEPIPKKKLIDNFKNEMISKSINSSTNIWDSKDQKDWVIRTCKKLGINPNHPGIIKRYKNEYYTVFGNLFLP